VASNEYPRVLYRDGTQEEVWGRKVDMLHVNDEDEQDAAMADGWTLRPDGNEAPKPDAAEFSLLDEKTAVIVEHIPALTKPELAELLAAEQRGKTRKGVLEALEAALAEPAPVVTPEA
jgi:hypothetical protein